MYDVTEYHLDAFGRVIILTHMHNGKTYERKVDAKEFMDKEDGSEIANLVKEAYG